MLIKAYSSSANLGAGFDILALAHNAFEDSVEMEAIPNSTLQVLVTGDGVPNEVDKNSASYAVYRLLSELDVKVKVKMKVIKGIPAGLGLGSSGASAVAAVVGVNNLLKLGLDKQELVRASMIGEIASSGSAHPDNVAASVYGGVVAVLNTEPVTVSPIPVNLNFSLLLFIPVLQLKDKTKKAREMLPRNVELGKMVRNSRYLSSTILGLVKGDRELLRLGLNDEIVEVARSPLFPHYEKLKKISIENNAIGACVSGAGPTIAVFVDEYSDKNKIKKEGLEICETYSQKCLVKEAKIAGGAWVERWN
ncbi:homoserine kinase [Sulfolobus acidocaldarius]|uniref:Homoserine kinase n=4 Tax=Sulfolobus acidocaldarius TaxID=2285 RepID=KHSE_SULAC|nr:homoserine kinase [Sulfolobus acidocaldarius]Q4JA46.1 RecName: Full=Homoserine kinase; Short=HK; Short=HSK [Sulfolobus acidocaldarius DSM 639]AAY80334.1 homoserine kinase [Sulfolobus acidocaldarius DSM 639]AGE70915.1 homoserine kinase [Sulfolobus acidocaldarius N8]AGE73186.1 homoserine kinase [Sulfolobus acidocaldarius Ron12/I]ALU28778.1 homoserine kinase [Sulfolobus acidocaldarius]ALU31498.1 homoserine kinase [Sulfolobus acidocaldarius]